MEIYVAAALGVLCLTGILLRSRFRNKKVPYILGVAILSILLLGILIYLLSGFLLLQSLQDDGDLSERLEDVVRTESISSENTEYNSTETPAKDITAETEPGLPDDYDLPVSDVPPELPDPVGASGLFYEDLPRFSDSEELSLFFLNRLLNGQFQFDFYLSRELAPTEGDGSKLMEDCLECAMCYYLFSGYDIYTMYAEVEVPGEWVLTHLDIRYERPAFDLEARAEAMEYVLKHPVPDGGFSDRSSEMEYARGIHNFLIRRISYDPIGYDPETMLFASQYDGKQEAYNVLVSGDTSAVCAGYARGFALIAHYAGMDCAYVTGNEDPETHERHAWNVLYPCDGSEPVVIDVTWDDHDNTDIMGRPLCTYEYFYIPISIDQEHKPYSHIEKFLEFLHVRQ